MDMEKTLNLIANPGSASRKYALYSGTSERARLHFEWVGSGIVCTVVTNDKKKLVKTDITDLRQCASHALEILQTEKIIGSNEKIDRIGLRVVAPSNFFLEDRVVDDEYLVRLEAIRSHAPIHVSATLEEMSNLRNEFKDVDVVGISDSAFHSTKPDYAWNYGLSPELTDENEIKRYGYHGISIASVVRKLKDEGKLLPKMVVCHLGSGASLTAVLNGKSVDNTMGYSPLEGVIMSTRCGTIDFTAARVLKEVGAFDDKQLEEHLNKNSGLLGLGGSSDIRELLEWEENGDKRAKLALDTYVYSVQKSVGQMASALNGVDAIVFTGTVGERSMPMRKRILSKLNYLGLNLDESKNENCDTPNTTEEIQTVSSSPIYVTSTREVDEMVRRLVLVKK